LATPQHGNTQDISARHYLTAELGQSTADTIVPINNAEQLGLMARGEIDAAWAPEPWGARLEVEAGAQLIAEEKDLWPNGEFMLTLVIVRPEFLRDHPDIVTSFLQAHVQLTHRLASSPQQAQAELLDAMFDLTGQRLNPLVIEKAIRRVKFTDEISLETFQQYSEWAFALGFSRAKPDLDRLIDTTWLSRAQAETSANPAGSQRP
jgi:NitT/TauT family transport system substrate-binding protein